MVLIEIEVDELVLISKHALGPLIAFGMFADEFDLVKQDGLAGFLGKPRLSIEVFEYHVRVGG